MLLEPTSVCYEVLKKNRPNATIVHGGVCRERRQLTLKGYVVKFCAIPGWKPKSSETVECYPLKDVFESHKISMIDFMSIDSEGLEMEALQSIDFSKVDIRVLLVEWRPSNGDERRTYLQKFGYKSTFFSKNTKGGDELFWRPDLFSAW